MFLIASIALLSITIPNTDIFKTLFFKVLHILRVKKCLLL